MSVKTVFRRLSLSLTAVAFALVPLLNVQKAFADIVIVGIMSHPPALSYDSVATFGLSSTGPIECKIDDGVYTSCDNGYTSASLPNGEHTFTVHGVNADNPEGTATYTWTIAAASVTVTSPIAGQVVTEGPLKISGTTNIDDEIGVIVDGKNAGTATLGNNGTWSFTVPHVSAGAHSVLAQRQQKRQYGFLANRSFGTIDVVDVVTKTYVQEVNTSHYNYAAIYNSRNNKVYAASVANNACAADVLNSTSLVLEQSIVTGPDGSSPVSMALDPSGNLLYQVCYTGSEYIVTVVDTRDNTVYDGLNLGLSVGEYPSGIAINPSDTQIWVRLNGGIKIFNTADYNDSQVININPGNNAVNNIVFNQDGSKAYTGESDISDVYTINTSNYSVSTFQVDSYISNLAFTPDFSKLYAISSGTTSIYVLDPTTLSILDQQTTAQPPESLAITDDGLNFLVGDDHGSGQIYFGATSGNATVTNTVTAPNGGSYFTSTGNFIGSSFTEVLGASTTVSFDVKAAATTSGGGVGVPNTGLQPAEHMYLTEALIVMMLGLLAMLFATYRRMVLRSRG